VETIVVAFFVMLALTAAMAVGVMFGRQPIAGSCGGMKALGMEMECEVCGGNPEICEKSYFTQDTTDGKPDSIAPDSSAADLSRRVGR